MAKVLKAVHIILLLMLLLYCGLVLEQFLTKLIDPGNESLRFWEPGKGVALAALAFMALLGILASGVGGVKNPSWRLIAILQAVWLISFTWFGWFDPGGPFRLRELVGVDFSDPAAVRRAEWLHLLQAAAVYLAMALVIGLPVVLRCHRRNNNPSQGSSATIVPQH